MNRKARKPERRDILIEPAMGVAERIYDVKAEIEKIHTTKETMRIWKASLISKCDDAIIMLHEAGIPILEDPEEPAVET